MEAMLAPFIEDDEDGCPHPAARELARVRIPSDPPLWLCLQCKLGLERILAGTGRTDLPAEALADPVPLVDATEELRRLGWDWPFIRHFLFPLRHPRLAWLAPAYHWWGRRWGPDKEHL